MYDARKTNNAGSPDTTNAAENNQCGLNQYKYANSKYLSGTTLHGLEQWLEGFP